MMTARQRTRLGSHHDVEIARYCMDGECLHQTIRRRQSRECLPVEAPPEFTTLTVGKLKTFQTISSRVLYRDKLVLLEKSGLVSLDSEEAEKTAIIRRIRRWPAAHRVSGGLHAEGGTRAQLYQGNTASVGQPSSCAKLATKGSYAEHRSTADRSQPNLTCNPAPTLSHVIALTPSYPRPAYDNDNMDRKFATTVPPRPLRVYHPPAIVVRHPPSCR